MKMEIGYGNKPQKIEIEEKNLLDILLPNEIKIDLTEEEVLKQALENPIGTERIGGIVQPGEKIAVIVSDITRPCPSYKILPALFEELLQAGIEKKDITVIFALGSHRKHTEEEKRKLVSDHIYENYRCIDSDPEDIIQLGTTSGGTPVEITAEAANAHRRICVANIEYHYFAGYSGGAKSIMPGVSTRNAIQANHSKMTMEGACTGNMETNPVRRDLEEAVEKYCGIDFIVNVVLNEKKEMIHAVAGHFIEAHRAGCKFLDHLYMKKIDGQADIVLVSQGGAPKDLNLYQTQKALDNGVHAVKDGGIIILAGSCKEGMGEETFESWMTEAKSSKEIIRRIEKEFKLGGHKAAAIAMALEKSRIFLVSEMEKEFVKSIFMEPFESIQSALDEAMKIKGEDAEIIVMPYGGSTFPVVK